MRAEIPFVPRRCALNDIHVEGGGWGGGCIILHYLCAIVGGKNGSASAAVVWKPAEFVSGSTRACVFYFGPRRAGAPRLSQANILSINSNDTVLARSSLVQSEF